VTCEIDVTSGLTISFCKKILIGAPDKISEGTPDIDEMQNTLL
jgi:hypothetical protein